MPIFIYKALNKNNQKVEGTIFASTETEAIESLERSELAVKKIKEESKKKNIFTMSFGSVSFKDKMVFLKYLSVVLKSGLTVKKALEILKVRVKSKYFKEILVSIEESIEHGQAFHQSLRKYPRVFSSLFVNLIAVGEVSGNLSQVIVYLESLLQKEYRFKKMVKGAMAYPAVVLLLVVSVTIGLVKFIIPRVTKIFQNFDVELPIITRILIQFEKFLSAYWWLVILIIICVVLGYWLAMKVRSIRKMKDGVILRIPFIGSLNKQIQLTRFSHTVSTLLSSGIGVVEALNITADTLDNLVYKDIFKEGAKYVETGGVLSEFFNLHPFLFESMFTQMIKLGETTGSVEDVLNTISELFEEEVNDKIKLVSNLLGPVLLILMGLFVGAVAISIITPIYKLPSLIQNR